AKPSFSFFAKITCPVLALITVSDADPLARLSCDSNARKAVATFCASGCATERWAKVVRHNKNDRNLCICSIVCATKVIKVMYCFQATFLNLHPKANKDDT